MDFELKPLTLSGVCTEKCDALLVLVSSDFNAGSDALSRMVTSALKAGDLETKPGKTLTAYRMQGVAATAFRQIAEELLARLVKPVARPL